VAVAEEEAVVEEAAAEEATATAVAVAVGNHNAGCVAPI
jgi:hypothetical protein